MFSNCHELRVKSVFRIYVESVGAGKMASSEEHFLFFTGLRFDS